MRIMYFMFFLNIILHKVRAVVIAKRETQPTLNRDSYFSSDFCNGGKTIHFRCTPFVMRSLFLLYSLVLQRLFSRHCNCHGRTPRHACHFLGIYLILLCILMATLLSTRLSGSLLCALLGTGVLCHPPGSAAIGT